MGRAIQFSPYIRLPFNLAPSVRAVKRGLLIGDHGTSMRWDADIIGRLQERNMSCELMEIEKN